MAEEAQDLTVTNTGQPLACEIEPATTDEAAQAAYATGPTNVTVTIDPSTD